MNERAVERFELAVDGGAAALFAASVGYCVLNCLRSLAYPQSEVVGGVAFAASFLLCTRMLRSVPAAPRSLTLPRFEAVPGVGAVTMGELVLTEADRLDPGAHELVLTDADRLHPGAHELVLTDADRLHPEEPDPLLLDDILSEIGPDSRVVRLFDPSAVPTPGQLRARIDRHLDEAASPAAPADASQALFEALAQLRRSLA
jgi:hypothetical protein